MNDKTGGNRVLRRAGALAAVAAVAALATACGGGDPSSASSPTFAQEVALAHCMRSHGAPDFPDPDPSGGFSLHSALDHQVLAAYGACRHLLPGGPSLAQVQQLAQQEQRKQEQRHRPQQCLGTSSLRESTRCKRSTMMQERPRY